MDDAIPVALVDRAVRMLGFGVAASPGAFGALGVRREPGRVGRDHIWKLEPQPQEPVALGLTILNPEPPRLST